MRFRITVPDDLHVHLRQGEMLARVLPATARHFGRALVMPNTEPPVLNAADLVRYRGEIRSMQAGWRRRCEPLMAVKLVASTTPETVRLAKEAGAAAAKLYPQGVTTNSGDGVADVAAVAPALEAMERCGLVLCLHGEQPGAFCLDRETEFLHHLRAIALAFPRLRIVLEHVTTREAVEAVERLPDNVAATITVHHLRLTLDDVIGDLLKPHHFCKPVAKRPEDREALLKAATSGSPKFFLGTDSAPHARLRKECSSGCAGVYSAPVALASLAAVFEERGALDRLEAFTSRFGAGFYGLPTNEGTLELVREEWRVPREYEGIVPFHAGETLPWRVRA